MLGDMVMQAVEGVRMIGLFVTRYNPE